MLVTRTTYNTQGELMAPLPEALDAKHPPVGGTPTTETGYYHRFKFEAPTKAERLDKARRFYALMESVPGFSTLRLRPYEVRLGNYYRAGLDIVYAVESPGVR
ncbi:hypothetical protein [Arthrobacter sp. ES1]|uniref:hypothetical protein n=1 Tax=Arthrobacter sp. ES1 TaxID=1897056 RepID=UPI001CFFE4EB|nr:hypothetical protein [Arthrobacter sp. ES1]MCB5280571.1 hypothetical protein [Arthrobacter sp. ES1]